MNLNGVSERSFYMNFVKYFLIKKIIYFLYSLQSAVIYRVETYPFI